MTPLRLQIFTLTSGSVNICSIPAIPVSLHSALRLDPSRVDTIIVHSPSFKTFTVPSAVTVAILSSLDSHERDLSEVLCGSIVAVIVKELPFSPVQKSGDKVNDSAKTGLTVTAHEAVRPLDEVAVIVAFPALTAVTTPALETEATELSEEDHATDLSVASSGVIVAVSVAFSPSVRVSSDWLIEIPVTSIIFGLTVTAHEAVRPLDEVAVIVAFPAFRAVTTPSMETEATEVSEDDQITDLSVASSGVIVAVSIAFSPSVRVRSDWLIEMPVTSIIFGFTVTEQEAERPLEEVAVIVLVPALTAVTTPDSETEATELSEDDQITDLSVASSGVIIAVSLAFSPSVRVRSDLLIEIPVTAIMFGLTVTAHEAVRPLEDAAVIVAVPAFRAVTIPASETRTIELSEDDQVTDLSVASSGVIVAVKVAFSPSVRVSSD